MRDKISFVLLTGLCICGVTLFGCSPDESAEDDTAAEDGVAETVPSTESEAPAESDDTAVVAGEADSAEVPSEPAAESVDTSIRNAAEFGDDALLEGLAPDGWHQAGDIEHYNVARLYDKIDGRSELYMAYDVIGLSWVSFVHDDDPNLFMDAFVYDMRSATGAFGIYSVEREPDQQKFELGREGYRTDSNHFFWKGKYYVYVQTSLEEGEEAGLEVAHAIDARLEDSGGVVEGVDLVPTEGLVDDTIQYFRADAMSLDFMTSTFTAHYLVDGMDVTAFMTRRDSPEDAAEVAGQFVGYLEDYGDEVAKHDVGGTEITVADLGGGYFDGVFSVGNVAAGVSAVEGAEATLKAAKAILSKLQ